MAQSANSDIMNATLMAQNQVAKAAPQGLPVALRPTNLPLTQQNVEALDVDAMLRDDDAATEVFTDGQLQERPNRRRRMNSQGDTEDIITLDDGTVIRLMNMAGIPGGNINMNYAERSNASVVENDNTWRDWIQSVSMAMQEYRNRFSQATTAVQQYWDNHQEVLRRQLDTTAMINFQNDHTAIQVDLGSSLSFIQEIQNTLSNQQHVNQMALAQRQALFDHVLHQSDIIMQANAHFNNMTNTYEHLNNRLRSVAVERDQYQQAALQLQGHITHQETRHEAQIGEMQNRLQQTEVNAAALLNQQGMIAAQRTSTLQRENENLTRRSEQCQAAGQVLEQENNQLRSHAANVTVIAAAGQENV